MRQAAAHLELGLACYNTGLGRPDLGVGGGNACHAAGAGSRTTDVDSCASSGGGVEGGGSGGSGVDTNSLSGGACAESCNTSG
eukprot:5615696-Karenia_brevis.AAC.1